MVKKHEYLIEHVDYDENDIPFIDYVTIKADTENEAVITFRLLYGCEILSISETK